MGECLFFFNGVLMELMLLSLIVINVDCVIGFVLQKPFQQILNLELVS